MVFIDWRLWGSIGDDAFDLQAHGYPPQALTLGPTIISHSHHPQASAPHHRQQCQQPCLPPHHAPPPFPSPPPPRSQSEVQDLKSQLSERHTPLPGVSRSHEADTLALIDSLVQEMNDNIEERINLQKGLFEIEDANLYNKYELKQLEEFLDHGEGCLQAPLSCLRLCLYCLTACA